MFPKPGSRDMSLSVPRMAGAMGDGQKGMAMVGVYQQGRYIYKGPKIRFISYSSASYYYLYLYSSSSQKITVNVHYLSLLLLLKVEDSGRWGLI